MEAIINFLKLGLDGAGQRQKVLANNLANVSTPGYKRKDIDFKVTLKSFALGINQQTDLALRITNRDHQESSSPPKPFKKINMMETSYRNDKNSVGIDYEMSELVKNNIYYETLIGQINERFKNLNEVISRGGR